MENIPSLSACLQHNPSFVMRTHQINSKLIDVLQNEGKYTYSKMTEVREETELPSPIGGD